MESKHYPNDERDIVDLRAVEVHHRLNNTRTHRYLRIYIAIQRGARFLVFAVIIAMIALFQTEPSGPLGLGMIGLAVLILAIALGIHELAWCVWAS